MSETYRIRLNFLPYDSIGDFEVYRRARNTGEDDARPTGVRAYSLPTTPESPQERTSYWVSMEPVDDFEKLVVNSHANNDLTKWAIYDALVRTMSANFPSDEVLSDQKRFNAELRLVMRRHPEGEEQLVLQPYYLRAAGSFGLLVDLHFRMSENVQYRKVSSSFGQIGQLIQ